MISNEALILILYFIVNILTGVCIGLLDSRNFWKKKWEEAIKDENICNRGDKK